MILVPVDNTFSVGTIDHDALLNTHNLTTDIDHTAIQNIGSNTHAQIDTHIGLTNEHIDWTGATQTIATSGNITTTGSGIITSNTSVDATTFVNATTSYKLADAIIIDDPGLNNLAVGVGAGSNINDGQFNLYYGQNTGNGNVSGWHSAVFGNTGAFWHIASHRIAGLGADFSKGYDGVPQVWDIAGVGYLGFANNTGKYVSGCGSNVGENNTGDYVHFGGYQAGKGNTTSYVIIFETSDDVTTPLFFGKTDDDYVVLNANQATTNTVHSLLRLTRASTGTAANGLGVAIEFDLEDSAGNKDVAAYIDCLWTDATSGSEDADIVWKLMAGGSAAAERFRIVSTGGITLSSSSDNDIPVNFSATTNSGLFAWMEDEDYFLFSDDIILSNSEFLVLDKASGNGIKVDASTPTFGWRDLRAEIRTRGVGGTDPNDTTYIGNIKGYTFSVNDEAWVEFHIPHDYVIGTDIHLHFHWSHNSAIVTGGTITLGADVTYAKGHNQAAFAATVNPTLSPSASTTQYQHMVSEVQLSAASPSATQIDSDDLEPDGIILARVYLSANNITSSGAVPDPFIHEVDIHYQSSNIATKNKVNDFYA